MAMTGQCKNLFLLQTVKESYSNDLLVSLKILFHFNLLILQVYKLFS